MTVFDEKNMYDPYSGMDEYIKLERDLTAAPGPLCVTGCMTSQKISLICRLGYKKIVHILGSEREFSGTSTDYRCFGRDTVAYPAKDLLFYSADLRGGYLTGQRMQAIRHVLEDDSYVLLLCAEALMDKISSAESVQKRRLTLGTGMVFSMHDLSKLLTGLGYERTGLVETTGQYAVRGGIADIFPATEEMPVRIEFFDDEIDTIRRFNISTQRSLGNIDEVNIYPMDEISGDDKAPVNLLEYFGNDVLLIIDDPVKVRENIESAELEFTEGMEHRHSRLSLPVSDETDKSDKSAKSDKSVKSDKSDRSGKSDKSGKSAELCGEPEPDIFSSEELMALFDRPKTLLFPSFDDDCKDFNARETYRFNVSSAAKLNINFGQLVEGLKKYQDKKYRITVLTPSGTRTSHLASMLRDYGIRAYCPDSLKENDAQHISQEEGSTAVVFGNLTRGFEFAGIRYALLTESDMFGTGSLRRRKRKRKNKDGEVLGSLNELSPGDYVVHENHGIGIYRGIERIVSNGSGKDYISIEYAGGDNLYLPTVKLDLLQKYVGGGEDKKVRLNRLNGTDWQKARHKASAAAKDVAEKLIKLYARRSTAEGFKYDEDNVWQQEFEERFPYEETDDQLSAIDAVKYDMQSGKVMDRLICGDVGFGKTEIALRAAFKAVQSGRQVAYLVPTTILAQQHYNTFTERMKDYPIEIREMSRFRSVSENRRTAQDIARGAVDIVIGTHRILSKDVKFKNIGLLIVDEEQRFGVAHKEKIKELRANVDVLTLTATPIPRTLHMSLSGIRDLSLLEEPPFDRVPVQTYVMEYNEELVREAIRRELKRKGQVFYVYNRVSDIAEKTQKIRELVPDALVMYAHGQMAENELEDIMLEFVEGRLDVLVSTTIIETGLDIPNANTLIIDGAERMGLAQLYQIRGRVGRSNRTAYAFLMYRKDRMLGEEAEKRLKAIREFTEFGSGVKIAMRDLEIRGAGSVLGTEQHGEMAAVGYEMYLKLLRQAVAELKGEPEKHDSFETGVDCCIDAYISDTYIPQESQRLDFYKRIAAVENETQAMELKDELIDRYGDVPKETENLFRIALLKALAHAACVTDLTIRKGVLVMEMYPRADVCVENIPVMLKNENGKLRFMRGQHPRFIYDNGEKAAPATDMMLKKAEELLNLLKKK